MNNFKQILGFSAFALAAALPFLGNTPVLANLQEAGQGVVNTVKQAEVKLQLSAATKEVTLNKEGKEVIKWNPLDNGGNVKPGDVIRYTVDSKNVGQLPASDLEVVQPIPKGTVFELATAKNNSAAKLTYSIDQGKTFVSQPTIKVKLETGEIVEKPAPANLYTDVKWNFGQKLDPTMAVNAQYEVKVAAVDQAKTEAVTTDVKANVTSVEKKAN